MAYFGVFGQAAAGPREAADRETTGRGDQVFDA